MSRDIPANHDWLSLGGRALGITLLFVLLWEGYWRNQGYTPTLNDSKEAWTLIREKITDRPEQTVLIGASRMLYDFNLYTWQKARSELPLQLSTVGTNASVYLKHIATETKFRGLLMVGITPPLFFVPKGLPVETPSAAIQFHKQFTLAQRLSHYLYIPFDLTLGFLQETDLPLQKLFEKIPIQNRIHVQIPPALPPHFLDLDVNRQGAMTKKMESETEYQEFVQQVWMPLFTPPPPPKDVPVEKFKKLFAAHVDHVIAATAQHIKTIQQRGGKVVFIRFPSTEGVRELENKFAPREAFWDRLVNESKPDQAIHFEDHPTLQNFDCPEWSHLTSEDAKKYTQELLKIIA